MQKRSLNKLLDPIHAKSKLDLVIERITKAVADGDLQPGAQLPGERQVAEALQVSRAIVREAFSALHVAGLVERRSGAGSFISETANPSVLKTRAQAVLDSTPDPYIVWNAREALEPALWSLIREGADTDSIDAIEEALDAIEDAKNKHELDRLFEADRHFHVALVCATKNPLVIQLMTLLLNEMNNPLLRAMKETTFLGSPQSVEATVRVHRKILEAIRGGDEAGFNAAMKEHFRMILSYLDEGAVE